MSMAGEEVLFKDKGWIIKGIPGYEDMFDTVYHKCPFKGFLGNNWFFKTKPLGTYAMKHNSHCGHCGEDIPDSIMGIWKLKNFDLLEEPQPQTFNGQNIMIGHSAGQFVSTGTRNVFIGPGSFYLGSGKLIGRPGQVWEYKP